METTKKVNTDATDIRPCKAPWAVHEGRGDALTWTAAYRKQMCELENTSNKSEAIWQHFHECLESRLAMNGFSFSPARGTHCLL